MKDKKTEENIRRNDHVHSRITSVCIALLAFLVPFTIMCMAFAASDVYPFGDRQVLAVDAWHQYYPFLTELRRKIRAGESLLYCWHMGLGSGFTAIMAYYLASPLNLLFVLFPENLLREAFALLILIKTGIAGAVCAVSLNRLHKKNEYGTVIFSTFYALCSWTLGYYWNIMWLDTFALFPFVILGITLLVREKKYKLYTISLAASMLFNYYIGLMICIFTVIYFFAQCILNHNQIGELWRNLKNIILFSFLSIMMSAAVTLPSLIALRNNAQNSSPSLGWKVIRGWAETLAGTFAYTEPTIRIGQPNLYCGVICVIFLFVFYKISAITVREKIVYSVMVILLLISTNIDILDFVWHGFRRPNQIPYRYTFILAYLIVMLAHQAYAETDSFQLSGWLFAGIAGAVYFLVIAAQKIIAHTSDHASTSDDEFWASLLKNLLLITAYLVFLFLFTSKRINKAVFTLCLAVTAGLELVPTAIAAPEVAGVTSRNNYPDRYDQMQEILGGLAEKENEHEFYRIELARRYTRNPSVLYGYNGFDLFSSTLRASVRDVFENLGLVADDHGLWYYYQNSTPVNNTFLNLKYLLSKDMEITNPEYLTKVEELADIYVYKNTAYLPVGFMVENTMADFHFEGNTPFEKQNNLLKAAAGITEDVFKPVDVAYVGHENVAVTRWDYGTYSYEPSRDADASEDETFAFHYVMPEDGSAYVYMDLELAEEKDVRVGADGRFQSYEIDKANIFPAGTYKEGEAFSVSTQLDAKRSGNLKIYASVLQQDVFDQAYAFLKDEVLNVTESTSRSIQGTITAKKDGFLYTSIPYESGWNVYVDGRKAELTLIADAFIGVWLSGGEHTVEFKYAPAYVYLGILVTLGAIVLFVWICMSDRKKHFLSINAHKGS